MATYVHSRAVHAIHETAYVDCVQRSKCSCYTKFVVLSGLKSLYAKRTNIGFYSRALIYCYIVATIFNCIDFAHRVRRPFCSTVSNQD